MKKSKKAMQIATVSISAVLLCGTLTAFAGCGGKKDALVLMSEELNGLFNPYYSTAGSDMSVVGQTTISMLSTDEEGHIAFGDDQPVVVKDYSTKTDADGNTVYTFVIKNGIRYSDGVPLTMNDVLFNFYVYLDPAYTGSTTMYSTKIKGLQEYRLQTNNGGNNGEDQLSLMATGRARSRRDVLINLYKAVGERKSGSSISYQADPATMRNTISSLTAEKVMQYGIDLDSYKLALAPFGDTGDVEYKYEMMSDREAFAQLLEDYNKVAGLPTAQDGLFWKELETDWASAQSQFAEAPYTNQKGKEQTNFSGYKFDEISSFLAYEGFVDIEYDTSAGKKDYNKIVKVTNPYEGMYKTKEDVIRFVYDRYIAANFHEILTGWASGQELLNDFVGKARDVIMHENVPNGELQYKNISGIVSLGHTKGYENVEQVTLVDENGGNARFYTVAHEHDALGRPKNAREYDVLQITVEGTDPKAQWNFGINISPWHYYSDPTQPDLQVDIANDKFGVRWSDFKFHTGTLQGNAKDYTYTDENGVRQTIQYNGVNKNGVPLGAGPYVATDRDNKNYPSYSGFMANNIVYYKANPYYFVNVEDADESLHPPYIEKMRYQVISSANAIPALKQGTVDYIEPQLTRDNYQTLSKVKKVTMLNTWQLGYGYIGVNAGKVKNIWIRRAIMAAMDTTKAREYYMEGTIETIYWPMSVVSWAYPRTGPINPNNYTGNLVSDNGTDYVKSMSDAKRVELIKDYMVKAGVQAGSSELKITFTIAGASLTEHPCYAVFQHAKKLLTECGWNITISPDVNALTKLATGSLAVWAAAWGSTIDPDMYQVYHKNSTATSVLAWGYPEILANPSNYVTETGILNSLADLIDQGRETMNEASRSTTYKEAMQLVLQLAVELPVYQRKVLYAFNSNVVDISTLEGYDEATGTLTINPFSSPFAKLWQVKFN